MLSLKMLYRRDMLKGWCSYMDTEFRQWFTIHRELKWTRISYGVR